jgi:hypothetical protein
MMIRALFRYFVVLCTAVMLPGICLSQGTRLFGSADLVSKATEATSLTATENKELTTLRRHTALYKSITVVRLNRAALSSGVVSIVSPEGREYSYIGTVGRHYDQSSFWQGKSKQGTALIISYTDRDLLGEFQEDGRAYQFRSLEGGRAYIIAELAASPLQESPGMSGRQDPPGFLPDIKPLPLPPQPRASAAVESKR